jgi:8-oxo-dGTP diphosphatase
VCFVVEPNGASRPTADAESRASPPDDVRVVAAVIHRGDQLLICQRPIHKRHGGLWEFPGGKCERGETDAAALQRELREELGVDLVRCEAPLLERRDEGSPFVIVFVPVDVDGEPVAFEHTGIEWGTPAEIAKLPLAPSDRHFVEFLTAADCRPRE